MTAAAGNKTALIQNVDAHWYSEQFTALCPGYDFLAATDTQAALNHATKARVIIGLAPELDEQLIAAAPHLEWVQALTTGVDNLLTMPALKPDVALSNCSGFHGPQMSELAFLMMLGLYRNATKMTRNQANRIWERWPQPLLLHKTITILGVGAIAEELAARCNAFGMTVVGVSDGRDSAPGFAQMFKRHALHEAVSSCDFLCVLTPYGPSTHHIVDAQVFAAMPKRAVLINISRGGCVDETALIDALSRREIAAAGLDVFASEPLDPGDPIWSAPNTMITPHIGGMSDIYKQQAMPLIVENLKAFASHGASALNGLISRP